MADRSPHVLHASCVQHGTKGVLLLGPSGSGKSALALQLMSFGATLVSDDRTQVAVVGNTLIATPPPTIAGLIEARGIGILHAPHAAEAAVTLVVDLSQKETERVPPHRTHRIDGVTLPCLYHIPGPQFTSAILLWLQGSIRLPHDPK